MALESISKVRIQVYDDVTVCLERSLVDSECMCTAHCDGMYETADKQQRSYFTLHLYPNDDTTSMEGEEGLRGGATTFYSWDDRQKLDVEPKAGSVLVFQQRNMRHAGDEVLAGTKYTMRTDIMYEKIKDVKVDVMDIDEGIKEKVKKKWTWRNKERD